MQRNGTKTVRTIGVMGAGIVGSALIDYFPAGGRAEVRIYDPGKGYGTDAAINEAEVVFICVPTPHTPGRGFDDSFVLDAVRRIEGEKTVVIKSTVLPGTTELLQDRFPQHAFLFNPEFLRAATASDDFLHPDRQIVGCTARSRSEAEHVMALLPRASFELICPATDAEMAKFVANSFLAVKVSFANEVFDLCEQLGAGYDAVRAIVGADARIGPSHLDVFDGGERGYDGMCLPKDTKSLLDLATSAGVPLDVLRATDSVNERVRRDAREGPAVRALPHAAPVPAERAA
ncbi:MAG: hypothetical protein WEC75_02155 [Dehalococcoidia bacterium]